MRWNYFADLVLLVHAAYVAYVVVGLAAIVLGVLVNGKWVRNFWFRITHLAAILIVVAESIVGLACPLTALENLLRQAANQSPYSGSCVARWVQPLIFFDAPPWVFTLCYLAYGVVVGAIFVLAPPDKPASYRGASEKSDCVIGQKKHRSRFASPSRRLWIFRF